MPANPLSIDEISSLSSFLDEFIDYRNELIKKDEIASHIQTPHIPGILGESIVCYLIENGKILSEFSDIFKTQIHNSREKIKCDISITKNDGTKIRIQVKATGERGRNRLRSGDINVDYLIWIHFKEYYSVSKLNDIEVCILKNPSQHISENQTETNWSISQFQNIVASVSISFKANELGLKRKQND